MISADVTAQKRQQRRLGSGQLLAWLSADLIHRQHILSIITDGAPRPSLQHGSSFLFLFLTGLNSWNKVSQHKIQEIDTTLYNNLSNPVVMTKMKWGGRGGVICTHTACLCILLLSRPCVMSTRSRGGETSPLIGRRHGIVLDHSWGKCLGTPLPSVRGDGEQNGSPEAHPMTPLSAKYAKVTGFLLGKS